MRQILFLLLLAFSSSLCALQLTDDPIKPWPVDCRSCIPTCNPSPLELKSLEENVVVDLLDPIYADGVLSTERGGVLVTQGIRVQARKIVYVKRLDSDPPEFSLFCEGDLLIDYQNKTLVGRCFYYDLLTQSGLLIDGRGAAPPWYLGGKEIFFNPDGELTINQGYISTSESPDKDVMVLSTKIYVNKDRILTANNITFRLQGVPLAWFPKVKFNLMSIGDSPLAVQVGYGGFLKTNLSLRYRFLTLGELYGYLRLDGYLARGPGVGIETEYAPCDSSTELYTRSYYAHDISIDDPKRKDRYRLEGSYLGCWKGDIQVKGFYDFVSDGDMAAEYQRKDFDLNPAERTEIEFRKNSCNWIASLFTRVRVNRFQSINQELPTFYYTWRPFEIGSTGVIFENWVKASYFDYRFSDEIIEAMKSKDPDEKKVRNFHSAHIAISPSFYRPFWYRGLTITPYAGFRGIMYSNSQDGQAVGQAVGDVGVRAETSLSKCFPYFKHVMEPYIDFRYLTRPRIPLDHAYIFTIYDAYNIFGVTRFGVRNSIYTKWGGCINRPIYLDVWTNAFSDGRHIPQVIPKGYANIEWFPLSYLFVSMDSAWNFKHRELDFYNSRIDWTFTQNAALSFEYRHRSKYDWRKADFYNFLIDVTRSEKRLLNSPLSDKRDTFLARLFYRWNPDIWGKFILRHGWNRDDMPTYVEYEIEVTRVIFDHWHLIFTYENRESDNRYSATLRLAPSPPTR